MRLNKNWVWLLFLSYYVFCAKVYGVNKKPANQLALIKYIACNIVYYLTLGQIIFTFISVRRFIVKHSVSHSSYEGRYLRLRLVPSE